MYPCLHVAGGKGSTEHDLSVVGVESVDHVPLEVNEENPTAVLTLSQD